MEVTQLPNITQDIWTELLPGQGDTNSSLMESLPEIYVEAASASIADTELIHPKPDERAIRMLAIFSEQSFNDSSYHQRMRVILVSWVLRNKLLGSLKRSLDVVICLLVLPFLLPILIITALAIKLDSPGPIIFRQKRVGKWGKPFTCFKFRSMYIDAEARKADLMDLNEADQIVFKIAKDPRVTHVGRVIRKLSIDELPQVFNVLKGNMSLVGPRPPVPSEVANYELEHMRRLYVVPGITGLQQVSGRSTLSFDQWIELDLKYIQQQSFMKDVEILIKTIPAVISGKGAY